MARKIGNEHNSPYFFLNPVYSCSSISLLRYEAKDDDIDFDRGKLCCIIDIVIDGLLNIRRDSASLTIGGKKEFNIDFDMILLVDFRMNLGCLLSTLEKTTSFKSSCIKALRESVAISSKTFSEMLRYPLLFFCE